MSISSHVLDTTLGRPACDLPVSLAYWERSEWMLLNGTTTDGDGRIKELLPGEQTLRAGLYRVRFDTASYYEANGAIGLYPYVDIVFEVRLEEAKTGEQHYHIPLLLTANGYTTYRGS